VHLDAFLDLLHILDLDAEARLLGAMVHPGFLGLCVAELLELGDDFFGDHLRRKPRSHSYRIVTACAHQSLRPCLSRRYFAACVWPFAFRPNLSNMLNQSCHTLSVLAWTASSLIF